MTTAKAEARRVRWGYEDNTPRCRNCRNYRPARMPEGGGIQAAFCVAGKFNVQPQGSCDRWVDTKTGERLA